MGTLEGLKSGLQHGLEGPIKLRRIGLGNAVLCAALRDFSAGRNPCWVAVGDFNGDGALDFAVANPGSDDVSVLLSRGDGGKAKRCYGYVARVALPEALDLSFAKTPFQVMLTRVRKTDPRRGNTEGPGAASRATARSRW
jgi:hypothetical protein